MPREAGQTMASVNAEASAGGLFPKTYSFALPLTVATHTLRFTPRQSGVIRYISICATFPNTMTVDVQRSTSSITGGARSLTTNQNLRLQGFGSDVVGPVQNINTDTPANRALCQYSGNSDPAIFDEIEIVVVVNVGAATAGVIVIDCDERQ